MNNPVAISPGVGLKSSRRFRVDTEDTPQIHNNKNRNIMEQQNQHTLLQYSPSPLLHYSSSPYPPLSSCPQQHHFQYPVALQQRQQVINSTLPLPTLQVPRSPLPCKAPNAMCVSPVAPPPGSSASTVSSLSIGSAKQVVVAGPVEDEDAPFVPPAEICVPIRRRVVPDWLRDARQSAPAAQGEAPSPVRENALMHSAAHQELLQYPGMPPPPLWTGAPSPARLRPSLGRNGGLACGFSSSPHECNAKFHANNANQANDSPTETEDEGSVEFMDDEGMHYHLHHHLLHQQKHLHLLQPHLHQQHQLPQQTADPQQQHYETPPHSNNSSLRGGQQQQQQHPLEIPSTTNHSSLLGQRPRRRQHNRHLSSTTFVSAGSLVGQSSYVTAPTTTESSLSMMSTSDRGYQNPEGLGDGMVSPHPATTKHRHSLVRNEIKYMLGKVATPVRHLIKSEEELNLHRSSGCLT